MGIPSENKDLELNSTTLESSQASQFTAPASIQAPDVTLVEFSLESLK